MGMTPPNTICDYYNNSAPENGKNDGGGAKNGKNICNFFHLGQKIFCEIFFYNQHIELTKNFLG